jgi:hypothetical protein
MLVAIGPRPAALVRSGLTPRQADRAVREWERWDAHHGFRFRHATGISTNTDRKRLAALKRRRRLRT